MRCKHTLLSIVLNDGFATVRSAGLLRALWVHIAEVSQPTQLDLGRVDVQTVCTCRHVLLNSATGRDRLYLYLPVVSPIAVLAGTISLRCLSFPRAQIPSPWWPGHSLRSRKHVMLCTHTVPLSAGLSLWCIPCPHIYVPLRMLQVGLVP